jgi:hypothetical protein
VTARFFSPSISTRECSRTWPVSRSSTPTPTGHTFPVLNRLSFAQQLTSATTPEQRRFFPTSQAPLQKFHWVHFPPDVKPGTFTYKATAMLFQPGSETALTAGPSVEVGVTLMPPRPGPFQLGFTRGYLSSQAYAEQFHNDPIAPKKPAFDFDTGPFQAQYRWLGFHARRLIFDFLAETLAGNDLSLDVFAYDLDEPDFIRQLGQLGSRLRLYLDDSASHIGGSDPEPKAHAWLAGQGVQVRLGHFQRFSHDKVLIQKRNNTAVKVLSGSANFSVRGLYVQSNNVFTFDDPATAALYEQAFQQSWDDPGGFDTSALAASWHDCGGHDGLPSYSLCFSPHHDAAVSLDRVADAVTNANSSVLFAIMEIGAGTGRLLDAIRALPSRPELYAFGTTQRLDGSLKVQKSGDPASSPFIPFSFLSSKVPAPFRAEWGGGAGQVIHHKFVVTDFNGDSPRVFAGSSNLAAGRRSGQRRQPRLFHRPRHRRGIRDRSDPARGPLPFPRRPAKGNRRPATPAQDPQRQLGGRLLQSGQPPVPGTDGTGLAPGAGKVRHLVRNVADVGLFFWGPRTNRYMLITLALAIGTGAGLLTTIVWTAITGLRLGALICLIVTAVLAVIATALFERRSVTADRALAAEHFSTNGSATLLAAVDRPVTHVLLRDRTARGPAFLHVAQVRVLAGERCRAARLAAAVDCRSGLGLPARRVRGAAPAHRAARVPGRRRRHTGPR